jgi:ribosomal protein S18
MAGRGNKPSGSAKRPRKEKEEKAWQKKGKRKFCIFCKERTVYIDYKDTVTLRKFTSERGKIRARRVTGNCVQHQRDVATAVKNARQMAMLPYAAK